MKFYYEIEQGPDGFIEAESIEAARAEFRRLYPEIREDMAGVWPARPGCERAVPDTEGE